MITLLHLSDLHFGPPFLQRVADAVLRLAAELNLDAIVVSGDLTQRAKPEQFQAAAAFLDQLPALPRLVMPGNHDVPLYRAWERLTDPLGAYRGAITDPVEGVIKLPGATLVGMDSTSPHRTVTRGRVTSSQLARVRKILREVPEEDARIVVAHHHFVEAPDALSDRSMLGGSKAMKEFISLGVDLVLGGHLHRAFIGNSLDYFFEGPRDRGVIVVQAGTATSRRGRGRERERNSLNLIRIHDTWLEVTHYLYFDKDDAFGAISQHVFPRAEYRLPREILEARSSPTPVTEGL